MTYHSPLNVPRPLSMNGFPMTPSLRMIAGGTMVGASPMSYHSPMHVPAVLSVGADPTGIGGAVANFGTQVGSGVGRVMTILAVAAVGYLMYKKEFKRR